MTEASESDLVEFLRSILTVTEFKKVHIIAHSLGTRLLSRALKELSHESPELIHKIGEIILAAPDIGAAAFDRNFKENYISNPEKTTIYASNSDYALVVSNNWHGGKEESRRLGEVHEKMLVISGLDTIDISGLDGSIGGHSVVKQNPILIRDLFDIISSSRRPKNRCCFDEVQHAGSSYWKLLGK